MDVPLSVLAKSLSGFTICHFKDINHDPKAPAHFYVTVPINDDLSLLLCVITSQIENRVRYYHKTNERAIDALVQVDKKDLPFLDKVSVIECNQPVLIRRNEMDKIIDPKHKFKIICRDIPRDLKEKIVSAINKSPIVKPFIKKMLIKP